MTDSIRTNGSGNPEVTETATRRRSDAEYKVRVLEEAGVWPDKTVELGSTLGVLAAVAAGYGAGMLPRRLGLLRGSHCDAGDLVLRDREMAG